MGKATKTRNAPTMSEVKRRERHQAVGAIVGVGAGAAGVLRLVMVGGFGVVTWGLFTASALGTAWWFAHQYRSNPPHP